MARASKTKKKQEGAAEEIGARLRAARARVGMTRRQLAKASQTSERYLAVLEGGGGNPSVEVLKLLAEALDMAMVDLLPLGGEQNEERARVIGSVRRLPVRRLSQLAAWLESPASGGNDKGKRIVLIGLRGAGKSSLGEAVASRLKMPFVEMTKAMAEAYGGELSLLIERSGRAAVHEYEERAWEKIVWKFSSAVIAVPGSIVSNSSLFSQILSNAHSIWLQAKPEDHMGRVMAQGDFRPMTKNRAAMADLKAILDARVVDYGRADTKLNTSTQGFESTLDLLEQRISKLIVE